MNEHIPLAAHRLNASFQSLRKVLLNDPTTARLDKPLAYWALPEDRRLPLVFLGRTIREILEIPFEEIAETPGIGLKKMNTLVRLLTRASKDRSMLPPVDGHSPDAKGPTERSSRSRPSFDASVVSEMVWEQWRETVRRHDLGYEKLGRLAPSLQQLPRVIWHTPLQDYIDTTLSEMRQLKTHGQKRVQVILQVFHYIHDFMAHSRVHKHLTARLIPKFVAPIEQWISRQIDLPVPPDDDEVRRALTIPLLEQAHLDAGTTIARLAQGRLGIHGEPQSVRDQSRRMGVTRARIYQLLEECPRVMAVRWPEGRCHLKLLIDRCESVRQPLRPTPLSTTSLLRATAELFFPDRREMSDLAISQGSD